MKLLDLVKDLNGLKVFGDSDANIVGITDDSRKVKPGFIFAAVRGHAADGHKFITKAIESGATAILLSDPQFASDNIPYILANNIRPLLGPLASRLHGDPSSSLNICGITGTNGKTSTCYIAEAMLKLAGKSVGVIGTINYRYADKIIPANVTTPGAIELQNILADMRDEGVEYCIFEVSSHALDQQRVAGVDFDSAVFTNLSRDHLDYHAGMQEYLETKSLLFKKHLQGSHKAETCAVLNIDAPEAPQITSGYDGKRITLGIDNSDAELQATDIKYSLHGTEATITYKGESARLDSPLLGAHNLSNILQSVGIGLSFGLSLNEAVKGSADCAIIPGRLERVTDDSGINIFVDYSHTPDALEKTLLLLSKLCDNRLICVVGCGGDRDKGKRPLMGGIAAKYSDLAVLTSDNPRTEDPEAILDMVEEGALAQGMTKTASKPSPQIASGNYYRIQDRAEAIMAAVLSASAGDAILIAGKGHEDYQIVGTKKRRFDDRIEAAKALKALKERDNG